MLTLSTVFGPFGVSDTGVSSGAGIRAAMPSTASVALHSTAHSHRGVRLRMLPPLYPESVFELVPALSSDAFILGRNDLYEEDVQTVHAHTGSHIEPSTESREDGRYVYINSRVVSKRHARIDFDGDQVLLTDIGSSHGTWVLREGAVDRFLTVGMPFPLEDGDEIRIGRRIDSYPAVHLVVELVEPFDHRIRSKSPVDDTAETGAGDGIDMPRVVSQPQPCRRSNTNCYRAPDSDMDISPTSSPPQSPPSISDTLEPKDDLSPPVADPVTVGVAQSGPGDPASATPPLTEGPVEATDGFPSLSESPLSQPFLDQRSPLSQPFLDQRTVSLTDIEFGAVDGPARSDFLPDVDCTPSALLAGFTPENMQSSPSEDMSFLIAASCSHEDTGYGDPTGVFLLSKEEPCEDSAADEAFPVVAGGDPTEPQQTLSYYINEALKEDEAISHGQDLDPDSPSLDVLTRPPESGPSVLSADIDQDLVRLAYMPPDASQVAVEQHLDDDQPAFIRTSIGMLSDNVDGSCDDAVNPQDMTAVLDVRLAQLEAKHSALRANAAQHATDESMVTERDNRQGWDEIASFVEAVCKDAHAVRDSARPLAGQAACQASPSEEASVSPILGKRKREDMSTQPIGSAPLSRTDRGFTADDSKVLSAETDEQATMDAREDGRLAFKRRRTPAMLAFLAGGLAAWMALGCDIGL